MRNGLRASLRAAVLAAAGSALIAGPASADVTSSQVTVPSDPSFFQADFSAPSPGQLTISGTTTNDGTPGNVDLICDGDGSATIANGVPVDADGTFSWTGDLDSYDTSCVVRAVPAGTRPSDMSAFTGPRAGFGEFDLATIGSGPSAGQVYDFYAAASQLDGYADYVSVGSGGLYDANPLDAANGFSWGADLFYANAYLASVESARSQIQVDGSNAYAAAGAQRINRNAPGLPALSVTRTLDPATGNFTIHESEDVVKCAAGDVYAATRTSCAAFAPTGVRLERTIVQDHGGRQATITDFYRSTDGTSHAVDVRYGQDFSRSDAAFDFPWVDGGTYSQHVSGDVIAAAPAGPASVHVAYSESKADGSPDGAQGAITFAEAPSALEFVSQGLYGSRHLVAAYQRTVPAEGGVSLRQTFSWAFTRADAQALASAAEDAAVSPAITVSAPADGSTVNTQQVTVSGVATDNKGVTGLTINGNNVTVGAGGGFSAPLGLVAGANTITAVAYDASGNSTTAVTHVTFAPQTAAPSLAPVVKAQPKACASRRFFSIHLPRRSGRILKAVVLRDGKRVRGVKVRRTRAGVDLRGLPKGTYKVRLTIKDRNGHTRTQTRTYRACSARR